MLTVLFFRALSWCAIYLSVSYLACWRQKTAGLGWKGLCTFWCRMLVIFYSPTPRKMCQYRGKNIYLFCLLLNFRIPRLKTFTVVTAFHFSSRRKNTSRAGVIFRKKGGCCCFIYLFIYLFVCVFVCLFLCLSIYGIQNKKPIDEMQKSQRPHIKADQQWF